MWVGLQSLLDENLPLACSHVESLVQEKAKASADDRLAAGFLVNTNSTDIGFRF